MTPSAGDFHWFFAALYAVLPVILVALLWYATKLDPQQRGNWRDFVVLAVLGIVVEFRLFEQKTLREIEGPRPSIVTSS